MGVFKRRSGAEVVDGYTSVFGLQIGVTMDIVRHDVAVFVRDDKLPFNFLHLNGAMFTFDVQVAQDAAN